MSVAESKVVVAHREDLWWLLAEACQLEHMLMCQYLFAEWTLKDQSDGVTDQQSQAVERWRGVLRGKAMGRGQEFLTVGHLPGADGRAAGFAFEMHYLMGNFVPWREPAWALLRERMAFLAERFADGPDVVRGAGDKAAAPADRLVAHIPAELRSG